MSWLRDRVRATPQGAPPDVLRQYARCYIMMMIGGGLFPDKTNNIVSLRFPSLCQPGRDIVVFPLASRLNGLPHPSRDTHTQRMLELRYQLDRIGFDEFVWTPYTLPAWRDIEPDWVREEGEVETWRAVVPIFLFMFVRFHHADRLKRQFKSEQPIPEDPVNLDGFLSSSTRGDDKWWPNELSYWYELWNNHKSRGHQI
ncbi:hypothetical protein PIB30_039032 [Stylosanthes scabra]|uniref:Aminotransferase-like plant mobile domain-containing protein n=1 Tax=Stylosanthes scabra TaxID=79078 RepID=A0ABU6REA4_9FABA|nr:hypothetical protein [Stylosanthes scabra]